MNTWYQCYHKIDYTEEGAKYHFGDGENVEVANIEFGEITGILEIKALNGAEVKYTEKRKNITPFGKALGIKEEILDKNISMRKYDDGWRIE